MGEAKCCCFIPIEAGVKILASFCILAAIFLLITYWIDLHFYKLFWPVIVLYAIMSSMWIYAFASPS